MRTPDLPEYGKTIQNNNLIFLESFYQSKKAAENRGSFFAVFTAPILCFKCIYYSGKVLFILPVWYPVRSMVI